MTMGVIGAISSEHVFVAYLHLLCFALCFAGLTAVMRIGGYFIVVGMFLLPSYFPYL